MFDSRTDAPFGGVHHERANYRREAMMAEHGKHMVPYRALHQEPAPDYDEDDA